MKMTMRIRKYFYLSECNPIFHNGQCFYLDIHGRLAIFDPKDLEGIFRISGKRFPQKIKDRRQAFMVESDGDLLSTTISEKGQIYVYKLHSSKRNWIYMENLDHKILYLSSIGSWAETTKFKGMGNKICFPKFQDNDILFYLLIFKTKE